jgi:hypothetical protein
LIAKKFIDTFNGARSEIVVQAQWMYYTEKYLKLILKNFVNSYIYDVNSLSFENALQYDIKHVTTYM